jgi:hypothetical protein
MYHSRKSPEVKYKSLSLIVVPFFFTTSLIPTSDFIASSDSLISVLVPSEIGKKSLSEILN